MTIEEMKQKFLDGEFKTGLYTSGENRTIWIDKNGFTISTKQDNGWFRVNIYEYIDNKWIESETYEK